MKIVAKGAMLALTTALFWASGSNATPSGLAVKGDQQAWAEITAALANQSKAKSYRAKMTNQGSSAGAPGTIEFVNPDRYHIVTSGFESIQIGTEVRVRMGSGSWQCSGQSAHPPVTDPSGMSGEVEAARGPDVGIDGVQTRSYTYTWKPGGGAAAPPGVNLTVKTRLFVASASGLPKRAQILDKDDQVQTQFDYYDYGAPITITLPSCQ